ncbi:hypothetical protein [Streptomyces sp. H34-S4]|uniref:hypothetical protein n=1 Tax=Streptomyces sp. H34-S4 TaxID=2996463 RepID=UPI00226DC6D1|nr:hypothetical protein [Streptomyces sp. H34-S4]MCY0933900.1 hypothetical protein [Streptomyces sp. H34-S4]
MFMRATIVGMASGALIVGGGVAANAATTSTQLSNGRLGFTAVDAASYGYPGSFMASTEYKKTGGSTVSVRLQMDVLNGVFGTQHAFQSVSAGGTVITQFGVISKAKYAPDCKATGMMLADGKYYYTPTVRFC